MILHEYVSVHRCFSRMRQQVSAKNRITFEELALLCHLSDASQPLFMSQLAEYQRALRPTITHRVAHLASLGLVERLDCSVDKRNICSTLTPEGKKILSYTLNLMRENLQTQQVRDSVSSQRMCEAIDKAGSISLSAADHILVALYIDYAEAGDVVSVGALSESLGILQPTVSMAISLLADRGLIERTESKQIRSRSLGVMLSQEGRERAQKIAARIEAA